MNDDPREMRDPLPRGFHVLWWISGSATLLLVVFGIVMLWLSLSAPNAH